VKLISWKNTIFFLLSVEGAYNFMSSTLNLIIHRLEC
jgi:hypothetical protein